MSYSIFGLIKILAILIIFIGFLFLQIYISKKAHPWYGIIIPLILFAIVSSTTTLFYVFRYGQFDVFSIIIKVILANISTLILLSIYFYYRRKAQNKANINKMNIQDL